MQVRLLFFGLAFDIESVALHGHGDQAAARLALDAVQADIESQAGIFVVQPAGPHVGSEVVQRTDDVSNQVLIIQGLSNHVVFLVGGKADGSGDAVKGVVVPGAESGSAELNQVGVGVHSGILLCICYWFPVVLIIVCGSHKASTVAPTAFAAMLSYPFSSYATKKEPHPLLQARL